MISDYRAAVGQEVVQCSSLLKRTLVNNDVMYISILLQEKIFNVLTTQSSHTFELMDMLIAPIDHYTGCAYLETCTTPQKYV